ncbi:FISUMP domain-containing protein [Flavobacterium sp. W22_SRS_FP1]|uniref:FISUMP domain-containing protein n=1 Tax=Flavobacterium sp. W22_SRS_FP1 TaxID=3240276 RepID=UPI003F91C902
MKKLLLLLLFFTGYANAQVMPFGMMNPAPTVVRGPVYVPKQITSGLTAVWESKNLDVSTYKDGTLITQITNSSDWASRNSNYGAWAYSGFTQTDDAGLGKFYDFYAVSNTSHGGLAPEGWRIATKGDFETLIRELNGGSLTNTSTSTYANKLKIIGNNWYENESTDDYNFSALNTSGIRVDATYLGSQAFWWTSTLTGSTLYYVKTNYNSSQGQSLSIGNNYDKKHGLGVRIVRE